MKRRDLMLIFILGSFSFTGSLANAEFFVDLPKNCYSKQEYPCTVTVESGVLTLVRENGKFNLSKNGVLAFFTAEKMQLLKGQMWISNAKGLETKISSILSLKIFGDLLVSKESREKTRIVNLNGQIEFVSKNLFPSEAIPLGFENWYTGLAVNGQILRGIIRPIETETFLKSWVPISGMSLASSRHKFKQYKENWDGTVEESARFYQQIAERRIASAEEAEERRVRKMRSLQLERQKIRKMFRQKLGLENLQGNDEFK